MVLFPPSIWELHEAEAFNIELIPLLTSSLTLVIEIHGKIVNALFCRLMSMMASLESLLTLTISGWHNDKEVLNMGQLHPPWPSSSKLILDICGKIILRAQVVIHMLTKLIKFSESKSLPSVFKCKPLGFRWLVVMFELRINGIPSSMHFVRRKSFTF